MGLEGMSWSSEFSRFKQPVWRIHFITVVRYSLEMNNCGMPTHCLLKGCLSRMIRIVHIVLITFLFCWARNNFLQRSCALLIYFFFETFIIHLVLLGRNAGRAWWVKLRKVLSLPESWVCPVSGVDGFHLVIGFFHSRPVDNCMHP